MIFSKRWTIFPCFLFCDEKVENCLYGIDWVINDWDLLWYLLSPTAPKARDGRYCNAPRPSVCLSVTFSFRTVTQKRIDVISRNFAGMCTMSWGCAV